MDAVVIMPLKFRRKDARSYEYFSDRLNKYITVKDAMNLSEKWGYPKTYASIQTFIKKCRDGIHPQAGCTLDELICWQPIHQKDRNFKNRKTRWDIDVSKTTENYIKKDIANSTLDEMLAIAHKAIKPLGEVCEN